MTTGLKERFNSSLKFLLLLVIAFLIVNKANCLVTNVNSNENLSPVILVPGDGGTQLQARWNKPNVVHYFCSQTQISWYTLWLVVSEVISPYFVDCFVDNMRLVYDNKTRKTSNSPGVVIRIPNFGSTAPVEYLDPYSLPYTVGGYYVDIVNSLVKIGYKRDKTIKGAPYDFRKQPEELGEYYSNLTKLIEDTFEEYKKKVILLAHSMGSPVLHYFFKNKSQNWKDKYIESLISLSGAWGGSFKPLKVFAVGDNLGYHLISSSKVKILQRTFSSIAFLLPSRNVWDEHEILVETPAANYSLSNIKEFFRKIPFEIGYEMYLDSKDLLYNAPPPGVKIYCLHGIGVPTAERIVFKENGNFSENYKLITGDGDGTVNIRSSQYCLQWKGKQKEEIYHKTFPKIDHMQILTNKLVLKYINAVLQEVQSENVKREKRKKFKLYNSENSLRKFFRLV